MHHVSDVVDHLDEEMVGHMSCSNLQVLTIPTSQLDRFVPDDNKPVSSLFTSNIPVLSGPAPSKPNEVFASLKGRWPHCEQEQLQDQPIDVSHVRDFRVREHTQRSR